MIEIFARVAMDMGRVPDRASLEALPKGQTLVFNARAANALRAPIQGQNCLVLDARGVKGWAALMLCLTPVSLLAASVG